MTLCTAQVQNPQQLVDAENIAPFVKVTLKKGALKITVGNESCQQANNCAVVKSFDLGISNAFEGTVEIVDQNGGALMQVMEQISQLETLKEMTDSSLANAEMEWGWLKTDAQGNSAQLSPVAKCYGIIKNFDVTYAGGLITYKLTITSIDSAPNTNREVIGEEDNKIPIKSAIRQLLESNGPKIKVKFVNADGIGEFKFEDENNRKSWYAANAQDKLTAVMTMLEGRVTDQERGMYPYLDPTEKEPTIVIREYDKKACKPNQPRPIMSFNVNGGNKSGVISFSPTVNMFIKQTEQKSNDNASVGTTDGVASEPLPPCEKISENQGTPKTAVPSADMKDAFGRDATKKLQQGQKENIEAASIFARSVIDAELKLQGTCKETFWHPGLMIGAWVCISYFNPFFLSSQGSQLDWLAQPSLNETLSGDWLILGANHSITAGSFTTTLKLRKVDK